MENPGLILVLGILLLFAVVIYWMIASNRRDKDKKRYEGKGVLQAVANVA